MILLDKFKKYIFYFYVFYVIYTPTFSPGILFDKYTLLYALMFVALIPYVLKRDGSLLKILGKRSVIYLMLVVFLSSIYFSVIQIINNIQIDSILDLRIIQNNIINVLIIHAAIIIDRLKKWGFSKRQSFELLLKMGALQGVVCLLGLFVPVFKDLAVFLYSAVGGSNPFVLDSRIYGISSDYTFGTPIYHGLLAGLAVYEAVKHARYQYYIYTLLILLSAFLNGRTGIVVFILVAVLSVIYVYTKKREKRKIFVLLGSIAIAIFSILGALQYVSPNTHQFVNSFVDDTRKLIFEQELSGNYKVLIEDSLQFPNNEKLITGEGYRVYDAQGQALAGFRSDIGYVNDLYMGGLIFVSLFYLSVFYFLLSGSQGSKFIFLLIIAVILIANFKGEIFRSSIFMFLIIYIKLLSLTFNEKEKA